MLMTTDADAVETGEWLDSLRAVLHYRGPDRAAFLLDQLTDEAQRAGVSAPFALNTPYVNTISPEREERAQWDRDIEHHIRSIIRWNAVAIILRANKKSSELGGHIASFQSAATLYDIGFGHFWHAPTEKHGGDLIYIQGHSAPGIYARAFIEGRLSEQQLLQLPAGDRRQGPLILPAPLADAGVLAIPDGLDGTWPTDGDLSGALSEISAWARHRRHRRRAKCGRSWATARWTSRNRSARFRSPDVRGSTI